MDARTKFWVLALDLANYLNKRGQIWVFHHAPS